MIQKNPFFPELSDIVIIARVEADGPQQFLVGS
jgi:hypothetical protein